MRLHQLGDRQEVFERDSNMQGEKSFFSLKIIVLVKMTNDKETKTLKTFIFSLSLSEQEKN